MDGAPPVQFLKGVTGLRVPFLLLGLLGTGTPAAAQTVRPWTEAIVSVTEFPSVAGLLQEVGGWTVTGAGTVDRGELDYWRLAPAVSARFQRLCAPQAQTGCIRLVRFEGAAQRPVRRAARPWDTGGIFSLMMRTDNVAGIFDRAIARGWWAESEPISFSFGSSQLRNVVITGPHGINFALYERTAPPFTAFPIRGISQAFNSMRMVRDQRASLAFYRDSLGFQSVFDADYRDPAPGPNNFSIPQNLTPDIVRRAAALQPLAGETGRVEVMQFVGFTGRDESAHAAPPNLGILSVRYPVQDLQAYRARLAARNVPIVYAARAVAVGGLGPVDMIAVRDPDGSITEFYEPVVSPAGERG